MLEQQPTTNTAPSETPTLPRATHTTTADAEAGSTPGDSSTTPIENITASEGSRRQKTLAVRMDEDTHTQLRFIADLAGTSIADEIRHAIQQRITSARDDPALIARADQVRVEIERSAAARSAAIAGFLGGTATGNDSTSQPTTSKTRHTATSTSSSNRGRTQ